MCSRCPGVHRMLSSVAAGHDGARHLDVDLTHRPDIAKHFRVLQTPTTLILDRDGAVQSRTGGVPSRDTLALQYAERPVGKACVWKFQDSRYVYLENQKKT